MKTTLATMFFLLCLAGALSALPPLPPCYHTYVEIGAELQQLQDQYPSIARLYTIGHSEVDNVPLYAFKISDNVAQEESEPAVLFIGQIHAEEVLGVETTMANINEILSHNQQLPYGNWISQLEIWFIPSLTPEGHNVVSSALDPSYRKNKHDNNNNGVFDYSPFVGYDIDGVDINRNFPFNWIHGDSLYAPGGSEVYDYYRGPAPGSESETQAFMQFAEAQKPVYTIVWHSSRSGNLSEKVFYPMNWYNVRPIPDLDLGQQIGEGVASVIITEAGSGGYEPSPQQGRKGDINGWLYKELGNICLVIECGTANLQPDSTLMVNTVQRCTQGVKWVLNRALPFSAGMVSNSILTGTITDAVTNAPLEAEIKIDQKHSPWFTPRKSFAASGRYWYPVHSGSYTIHYRKKGYAEHVIEAQNVNNGSWTTVNVALQPLPVVSLTGDIVSSVNGQNLPAHIVLYDLQNDFLDTDGEFMLNTYQGLHRLEVTSDGYYPYVDTLSVSSGISHLNLHIVLTPVNVVFSENWESGMDGWVKNGPWVLETQLAMGGHAITDSWGGDGLYAEECNVWFRTANPIQLPASGNPLLTFDEHLYTEYDYDIAQVEVSTDTLSWFMVDINSGQQDWWHPQYVSLSEYTGQNIYVRFHLTDQSTDADLTDPGWTIDNIKIITGNATGIDEGVDSFTPVSVLYPNYPNPFNPETTIRFAVAAKSRVKLDIYNLKGQRVRSLADGLFNSGTHDIRWNGTDEQGTSVASGIYFCKLTAGNYTRTQKMIMLK
jgi:hypothetical protein